MKRQTIILFFISFAGLLQAQTAADLSGRITKANGVALPDVTVKVFNANAGLVAETTTNADGLYTFPALPAGEQYTVEPAKATTPDNGVTVLDMLLARLNILGVQFLDSPFALLAGDINESQGLTTLDFVLMSRFILGLPAADVDHHWRFYRSDITFANPYNPWMGVTGDDPSVLLTGDVSNFDFIGVKPGDVDGSATP